MSARLIDGKAFAAGIRVRVAESVDSLAIRPGLAVVLVGTDPASQVYVRNKAKQTAETGMVSFKHELPEDVSEAELLALIDRLNADPEVHGILVQLPLPSQIDSGKVINAIDVAKDVDGFTIQNVGRLTTGLPALVPCTPLGCLLMLRHHLGHLSGLNAVVVGRSNIVGKPMASLLLREHCTVTIAHSRTGDLPALCRSAEILVAAVGRPEFVQGDWIGEGATVIDVGINRLPAPERGEGKTRIVGDVAFSQAVGHAGAITPVPGGVGPMTIACLLANTLTACCRANGIEPPADLTG
ncbi:MAG: bifunctional methylenetetrahydrofolate dehydrogenase/methenyltetrahydrofolate cyclohydrolase [Rhodobacteraceae bacterium]|nr:bifunctional methylenetetrahydrofolate dehydrogenase/methenyltetrahydrofolate cyclohydrolase [Paracoccaceae bacterium]